MKKNFSRFIPFALSILALGSSPSSAHAANFQVSNASDLTTALSTAQSNGADDTIQLAAGTYSGNFTYTAAIAENFSITLIGADPSTTTLNGGGSTSLAMDLSSITGGFATSVNISNMAFTNGFDGLSITATGATGGQTNIDNVWANDNANLGIRLFILGDSDTSLTDSQMNGNQQGLSTTTSTNVIIENCEFNENINTSGSSSATVYIGGTNITFNANTVQENENNAGGGSIPGIYFQAAGTATLQANANYIVNNHNTSVLSGGGLGLTSVAMFQLSLTNNIIADNSGSFTSGGGGAGASIIGGAGSSVLNIINNTIYANTLNTDSLTTGGGIQISANNSANTINLYNNIIYGNTAAQGTDVYINDGNIGEGAIVNFFNSDSSDLYSLCANTGGCTPHITTGDLQNTDPLFVDATNGNLTLLPTSPLINAGDASAPGIPSTDFNGNPRSFGGAPDIGAIETAPVLSAAPSPLNFGNVEGSESEVLTLTNAGGTGTISAVSSSDAAFSVNTSGGSDPCGATPFVLNANDSCTLLVTASPGSSATVTGTLSISSDDPSNPTLSVTMTANVGGLGGDGCELNPHAHTNMRIFIVFALLTLCLVALRQIEKRKSHGSAQL